MKHQQFLNQSPHTICSVAKKSAKRGKHQYFNLVGSMDLVEGIYASDSKMFVI